VSRRNPALVSAAAAAILAVAGVVYWNTFAPRTDTCGDPARLESMRLFEGAHGRNTFIYQEPDQPLWVDGSLGSANIGDDSYAFRFIRSYDVARFLQSGLLLLRNFPLPEDRDEMRILEIDGESVPVRIRGRETGNAPFVTAYIVAVGQEPVANPFSAALRGAFDRPLRGPKPVTILLMESPRSARGFEHQEARILEWLRAGWREYRAVCAAESGSAA